MNKKEIGQKLSKIRKEKKITKSYIELQAKGLYRHQILGIEKGTNNYSIDTLLLYCEFLDVKLELL
jgi:transcriptional regulator with XRE-family HTH domain